MAFVRMDPERCSEMISGSNSYYRSQCSRKGILTEGGKLYCKQHSPAAIQAKRDAQNAEWAAKRLERDAAIDNMKARWESNQAILRAIPMDGEATEALRQILSLANDGLSARMKQIWSSR